LTDIDVITGSDLYVCHNGKALKISPKAIPAHIAHGDYIGSCRPWMSNRSVALNESLLIEEKNYEYRISPNPSNGKFSLQLPLLESTTEIFVMNSTGLIIERRRVPAMTTSLQQFNLKGQAAGTYFIRIVSGQQTHILKTLIK
jgi:hypothetical protein